MNQVVAVLCVGAGGGLGAILRLLVNTWFLARLGPAFPWGTFTINVTGSFVIGIVLGLAESKVGLHPYARLFLATGILGGYTTFSSYAYETYVLGVEGHGLAALGYSAGSVVAGVAAAFAGVVLVRLFVSA